MTGNSKTTKYLIIGVILLVTFVAIYLFENRGGNIAPQPSQADTSTQKNGNITTNPPPHSTPSQATAGQSQQPPAKPRTMEPEIREALKKMTNTSSEGLVEEKAKEGYQVNLQGRFRNVPVAETNDQGEVEVRDYNSAPREEK